MMIIFETKEEWIKDVRRSERELEKVEERKRSSRFGRQFQRSEYKKLKLVFFLLRYRRRRKTLDDQAKDDLYGERMIIMYSHAIICLISYVSFIFKHILTLHYRRVEDSFSFSLCPCFASSEIAASSRVMNEAQYARMERGSRMHNFTSE